MNFRTIYFLLQVFNLRYKSFSESWVWWRADFQRGSRVFKKEFLTFSYLYLWHTMWFHAKKLLKTLKFWKLLNSLYKAVYNAVLNHLWWSFQLFHHYVLSAVALWWRERRELNGERVILEGGEASAATKINCLGNNKTKFFQQLKCVQ